MTRESLIVITDGELVVDHMEKTHLVLDQAENPATGDVDIDSDRDVFDSYLQRVLEKI